MKKRWIFRQDDAESSVVNEIMRKCAVSRPIAIALANRGLDAKKAEHFLNDTSATLHSPFLMQDINKACQIIKETLANNEKISVYGDYDVDGVTATAIIVDYLRKKGASVDFYIPERLDEGYGVSKKAIQALSDNGAKLIITVDCGITAYEETEFAKQLGVRMVITDHHTVNGELPPAEAVLNPKRPDCDYPYKELSGVGVAFKLLCALDGDVNCILDTYADLVAVGTIADVVSLTDENRILAKIGIEKLKQSPNIGLSAILDVIKVNRETLNASTISFGIAPRVNAAGRVSNASIACELILTTDAEKALEYAQMLDVYNRQRQEIEARISDEVSEMLKSTEYDNKKVLVLAKEQWHSGVIGIVASRVSEKYQKSCALISIEEDSCKGSLRSFGNFNMFDALLDSADLLEKFGGHALAAGISIAQENIEKFTDKINMYADRTQTTDDLIGTLYIDCEIDKQNFNEKTIAEQSRMEPFGMANERPIYALLGVTVHRIYPMSEGRHVRIIATKNGEFFELVGFNFGYLTTWIFPGDTIDVCGCLALNIHNNETRIQLHIRDVNTYPSTSDKTAPFRNEFYAIYAYLRKKAPSDLYIEYVQNIAHELSNTRKIHLTPSTVEVALIVFQELGLISTNTIQQVDSANCIISTDFRYSVTIRLLESKKVSLNDSATYRNLVLKHANG